MSHRLVLIVGAGFSRAISQYAPLTDELGAVARHRAGLMASDLWPSGLTFESWLSRLAEDQPDLGESENLMNRSRFVSLSEAIGEALVERQRSILEREPPGWLMALVGILHALESSVICFNYDTFIEAAVLGHQLTDWSSGYRVSDADVVGYLPPGPPGAMRDDLRRTFRLLKLHGSLNWWWSAGDQTGATINRWRIDGTFGSQAASDDAERSRLLPGRIRFIVPPTATKSGYYTNPFTREIWQRAARALAEADEIYLVGYSLPVTDLVVAGMIRHWVSNGRFTIVNPCCGPIEEHLLNLGYERGQIARIEGKNCVPHFVEKLERVAASRCIERVMELQHDESPLCVAWTSVIASALIRQRREGQRLVLTAEALPWEENAFRPRSGSTPNPVRLCDLLADLVGVTEVVVEFAGGISYVIVQVAEIRQATGYSIRWHALVPCAPPPPHP